MQRIPTVDLNSAPEGAKPVLEAINGKMGRIPNIFASVANSPAALKTLMAMFGALEEGELDGLPHEAIALRVGEMNGCKYCTAAHTAKAKMMGASDDDAKGFRQGKASNAKIQALLDLATVLAEKGGALNDEEFAKAAQDGLTKSEIMEALAIVILNSYTNAINALVQTEVDFPAAPPLG